MLYILVTSFSNEDYEYSPNDVLDHELAEVVLELVMMKQIKMSFRTLEKTLRPYGDLMFTKMSPLAFVLKIIFHPQTTFFQTITILSFFKHK